MDLTKIENPEILKSMSIDELNELAQEIRRFIIQSVAKTGGHISSNLGVVELTIALHYVFSMPPDKIFFDIGHQCYTHKILTGRAGEFDHLRQFGGISGFQRRSESPYDVWEAGHSSTSLSAALGMAIARDLNGETYHIVPVIGDGALSSGEAMEALNAIGQEQRNIVIVFNDNNMSISRNVGGMTKGFARLRSSKNYTNLKQNMESTLRRSTVGEVVYRGLKGMKDAIKETVIDRGIFGEFNLEYIGPVDGHNIKDLIQVLSMAKDHVGPIVVHCVTTKGKGYPLCEQDHQGVWHGVGPFNPQTGQFLKETPLGYRSWSGVVADTLEELAEENRDIVVLTPAMITGSALGAFFAHYPERSFDCGIAEEHAVTMAAGLAISGKRPFLSIYSSFLQRAYDQVNHDVCRMDLPVVFGIDRCGLAGEDGATHNGVFDIGFLRALPNMIISCPKDAAEARNLIATAFRQPHPFAIRYPKGDVKLPENNKLELLKIGTWTVPYASTVSKLTVISYGPDVDRIVDKAKVNELPITVVNARFIKPLDTEMIRQIAAAGTPVVVYESDMKACGLASAMLEYCNDQGISLKLDDMGIGDQYVHHGSVPQVRTALGIGFNDLMDKIQGYLDQK